MDRLKKMQPGNFNVYQENHVWRFADHNMIE